MSKAGMPDKWAKRLIERRFVDPRYKDDVPSMSALATKIGLHPSTVSDIIHGRRKPTVESAQQLVAELGPDVADWLGVTVREPFQAPPEADLLTDRQRKAINELIRSIVAAEQEESSDGAATSSPPDEGGGSVTQLPTPRDSSPSSGLAVASGGSGGEDLARQAAEQARKAREEQQAAIKEMKDKQRRKSKGKDA